MILRQLLDDDVPYAVLGLGTNESLGAEASAQKVDTPKTLPALNRVRAHAGLERLEDLRLPRPAQGLIFIAIDSRAKVKIDCEQDILDCDKRVLRGMSGIWRGCELPGKVTDTKGKRG